MKKSQVSLEFLMTYGWALLILGITLSALFYFSVINPSSFISERCIAEYGFECKEFSIKSEATETKVHIISENQIGFPIKVKEINIESIEGPSNCNLSELYIKNDTSIYDISAENVRIGATKDFHILMNCSTGNIIKDSILSVKFKLKYKPDKENYFEKTSKFEIVGKSS